MIDLLKNWFTECCNKHPSCRPPTTAFRPTRLLFIENEHSARVVETKDWDIDHSYVALSHCWGTTSRLELTKDNKEDLLRHIAIAGLPTTYREGISVSLALGLSYIWIDSLCIIQDDDEDWTKEATTMKDVFEHCSVNLSATAAADSSQSCFAHRDPTIVDPLEVTVSWQGERPNQSRRRRLVVGWVDVRQEDILSSPLHSRAWAFQEANLSRRRIDLARSQAWWHCQQNWACEMHPSGVPGGRLYTKRDEEIYRAMRKRRRVALNGPGSQAQATVASESPWLETDYYQVLRKHWFEPVRWYSGCAITKTTDRLVAFAGIAQGFAQSRGIGLDDYLAGIWRQGILWSLSFTTVTRSHVFRPDRYCAPSWSWASLEGRVNFRIASSASPLCKVVNAKVIHQFEHHQAGEVKGGVIHIKGRLVEVGQESQAPQWADNKGLEQLPKMKIWDINFDEHQGAKDSTFPHLAVSYLEQPQGRLGQRKEGIVDGAIRKHIRFRVISELLQHIRLFHLPLYHTDSTSWGISRLLLCQTFDDYLAGNAIYQRVGCCNDWWWRSAIGLREETVKKIESLPETDIYII